MADISFYSYLEAAFRYRLNDAKGKTATLNTRFNYLGYNFPYERIFQYARKILPQFYRKEFPNTEQGNLEMAITVLQKLDRKQDQALVNQFKGLDVSGESQQIIEEAKTQSQTEAVQQPVATGIMAGGGGLPPLSFVRLPVIHNIPQTKPPDIPKEAVTAKAEEFAQENPATAKIDRLNPAPAAGQTPLIKTAPAAERTTESLRPTPKNTIPQPAQLRSAPTPSRRFNFSAIRPSPVFINTAKNFTSPAGILFKRYSGGIAGGLGQIAKGVSGGIISPAVSSVYKVGGKAAIGGINVFGNISNQIGGGGSYGRGAFVKGSSKKIALAFLGVFLLFGIGAGLIGGLTGTTPTGEASPIGGGGTGADISSCKFTRSDQGLPAQFKSSTLLGYIQEASQKSSIPPVVLAAFIRVESPSSSNMSNDQIINYAASCTPSPTGALGIMQIQPPGTTSARGDPASCVDCIDAGAKLVGKTAASMTTQDYCDPKTNIIVGAGWILKKMSKLGYGDGTKWEAGWTNNKIAIAALVNTYYGCLKYGSADDTNTPCADPGRKYSYADDVSTSIQNCQAAAPGAVPVLPLGADYTAEIFKNFHINFVQGKFTENHLKWAWEILSQAKTIAPNFFNLVGTVTADTRSGIGERSGNTIFFSTDSNSFFSKSDESGFKVLLIHELGHVIRGNPGSTQQRYDQLLQQAIDKDRGYLTGYGQNPCTGTSAVDEDFAETVAYYINRGTPEKNLACGSKSSDNLNPLYSGRYPNHLSFIQSILGTSP